MKMLPNLAIVLAMSGLAFIMVMLSVAALQHGHLVMSMPMLALSGLLSGWALLILIDPIN